MALGVLRPRRSRPARHQGLCRSGAWSGALESLAQTILGKRVCEAARYVFIGLSFACVHSTSRMQTRDWCGASVVTSCLEAGTSGRCWTSMNAPSSHHLIRTLHRPRNMRCVDGVDTRPYTTLHGTSVATQCMSMYAISYPYYFLRTSSCRGAWKTPWQWKFSCSTSATVCASKQQGSPLGLASHWPIRDQ